MSKPIVYVALLRGINVGGKNKLPMKELAEIFAKAGCGGVTTYIQSGNVVFTAPAGLCDGLAEKVSKQIEKQFGHKPPHGFAVAAADDGRCPEQSASTAGCG